MICTANQLTGFYMSDAVLVSVLLTLIRFHILFWCFHFDFEQVNAGCEVQTLGPNTYSKAMITKLKQKIKVAEPILAQCSISIPLKTSENKGFRRF